jgi:hypothetical protein
MMLVPQLVEAERATFCIDLTHTPARTRKSARSEFGPAGLLLSGTNTVGQSPVI